MLLVLLSGLSLASALPQLVPRQACEPTVQSCSSSDLTANNWQAFGVDNFLSTFTAQLGNGAASGKSFPQFFVDQQVLGGAVHDFDCSTIGSECIQSPFRRASPSTDCVFEQIGANNVCARYISPEAGFVVENFVRFHQAVAISHQALEDSKNAILNANFISDMVDGLSADTDANFDAIIDAIPFFVMGYLPLTSNLSAGTRLFQLIDTLFELAQQGSVLTSPLPGVQSLTSSRPPATDRTQIKQQLTQALESIVTESQAVLEQILQVVFTPGVLASIPAGQQDSFAISLARSGQFLDAVPTLADATNIFTTNLRHFLVSAVMRGQRWTVLREPMGAATSGVDPEEACRQKRGIPSIFSDCAVLQDNARQPANPSLIQPHIDVQNAAANADDCAINGAGGSANTQALLDAGVDGRSGLPRCLYNFPVLEIRGVIDI